MSHSAENDTLTDAEIARRNGWKVGTVVRGHEQWADGVGVWSTWRITAIGEDSVLVRTIRRDFTGKGADRAPDLRTGPEHGATFKMRQWSEVVSNPEPTRVIPPDEDQP